MPSSLHPNLFICQNTKAHSIMFTKMRDEKTSSESFVRYSKRSMRLLAEGEFCSTRQLFSIYSIHFALHSDALAEFPTESVKISTPCGPFQGVEGLDPTTICAVSIVRSGDALLESVRDLEPAIRVVRRLLVCM